MRPARQAWQDGQRQARQRSEASILKGSRQLESRSHQLGRRTASSNVPCPSVGARYVNSTEGGAPRSRRAISSHEPAAATNQIPNLFELAV